MSDRPWYADAPLAALLRHARGAYGDAARRALAAAGFDDVPRNGGFVLAGLGDEFTPQADAVAFLRVSKQASSQLIDTLVLRGYLERRVAPDDRRRMELRPTERGRAAATAIQTAIVEIDGVLANRITEAELQALRTGLGALADIRIEREE